MDASEFKQRTRDVGRGPVASRRATLTNLVSIKSGNLFIEKVETPSTSVRPGGTVNIDVVLKNGAQFINTFDPDRCLPGGITRSEGYKYRLEVDPSWAGIDSREGCIPSGNFSANRLTESFSFTAPSESGSEEVTFILEARGSGESGRTSTSVSISESGDSNPPPSNGGGGGGDGGGLGFIETVGIGVVITLVLVVALFAISP